MMVPTEIKKKTKKKQQPRDSYESVKNEARAFKTFLNATLLITQTWNHLQRSSRFPSKVNLKSVPDAIDQRTFQKMEETQPPKMETTTLASMGKS